MDAHLIIVELDMRMQKLHHIRSCRCWEIIMLFDLVMFNSKRF